MMTTPQTLPRAAAPRPRERLLFFVLGCMVGAVVGFGAGVASVKAAREAFTGALRDESRAEVSHPRTLERPAFRLQYPGNWNVDAAGPGRDPDRLFSIHSPGHSFVMFVVAQGALDPEVSLDAQVTQQTAKVMRDATRTPFERWGAYPGVGQLLRGKMLGLSPGTIRIFAFRVGEQTFTVIESTSDEDRSKVAPGFALIERSFEATDAPAR